MTTFQRRARPLGHVNQLAVTDNPLLAEAAFDAFVIAVGSVPGECFNEECGCQVMACFDDACDCG